jgi:hypothetical protein
LHLPHAGVVDQDQQARRLAGEPVVGAIATELDYSEGILVLHCYRMHNSRAAGARITGRLNDSYQSFLRGREADLAIDVTACLECGGTETRKTRIASP